MWISERAALRRGSAASASVGPVTIGGADTTVLTDGEKRGLRVLAPQGLQWQPSEGGDVLVLETDDGERYILGAAVPSDGLQRGELLLQCGGTKLKIGPEGVEITGQLRLNGRQLWDEEGT